MENEYEAERARKIAENKAKLQALGLVETSKSFRHVTAVSTAKADDAPSHRYKSTRQKNKEPREPTRSSKRLRGDPSQEQTDQITSNPEDQDNKIGYTSKGSARKSIFEPNENVTYCAPFTIASTSITIDSLGEIYRGPWSQRFWSSSSCAYHHAYPIGYRATKKVFNRTYEMRIEAGTTNPIFIVIDQETGQTFQGNSPTAPWTDVCIAHKTGQRISGPLFFGFSDSIVQAAVASMYNERERQAAANGEVLEPEVLSPEEQAAKEFQTVNGIGDAVAMVLALTTTFGGSRHSTLQSLKEWIQQSQENADKMKEFLLTSEELSSATKKWPAWRSRLVPKIMNSLLTNNDNGGDGDMSKKKSGSNGDSGNNNNGNNNKMKSDTINDDGDQQHDTSDGLVIIDSSHKENNNNNNSSN